MCGRLLKSNFFFLQMNKIFFFSISSFSFIKLLFLFIATYIPPEKQHYGFFAGKPWTANIYPTLTNRIKELKKNESPISVKNYRKNVRRSLRQLADLEEKLKNEGVNVKFKPVNVPKDITA